MSRWDRWAAGPSRTGRTLGTTGAEGVRRGRRQQLVLRGVGDHSRAGCSLIDGLMNDGLLIEATSAFGVRRLFNNRVAEQRGHCSVSGGRLGGCSVRMVPSWSAIRQWLSPLTLFAGPRTGNTVTVALLDGPVSRLAK